MTEIKISYDRATDVLEVLFDRPIPDEEVFELSFNIVLFVNPHTGNPINLTIIDYRHLLQMESVTLELMSKMPTAKKAGILKLITKEPVCNFLQWMQGPRDRAPKVRILSPEIQQLLAA